MFDGTEYWWKIWRKTEVWFPKLPEEFEEISPEDLIVSILRYLSEVENVWA